MSSSRDSHAKNSITDKAQTHHTQVVDQPALKSKSKVEKPKIDKQNKRVFGDRPIVIMLTTISLYFIAQFIAGLFFILLIFLNGWSDTDFKSWFNFSALPQFIYVVITDVLIVLGIWLILRKRGRTFRYIGLQKPLLSDALKALLAFVCYIVLVAVVSVVAKLAFPSLDFEQKQQLGFEANKGIVNLLLAGISLVILPPIVEEILCRGYLFTGLRARMKLLPTAILVSLVFAVAHLQFGSNSPLLWVAAIDTFVLSLVLVYLREKTGRLAAPMFLHAYKNLIAFSAIFIFVK